VSADKVPKGQQFKATCSKCRRTIIVEPQSAAKGSVVGVDASLSEVADAPTAIAADLDVTSAYDSPLEVLEEGARSALVCVDEPGRLRAVKEALSKLRYNQYDLVMLDEEFCGENAENNTILRYLQPMPMSTRRNIFLMLISSQVKTLDNLMAFAKSVNAVINVSDIQKVKLVLERAIADHRRFYKVYWDLIKSIGIH